MPAAFEGSSFLLTYPQSSFGKQQLSDFLNNLEHVKYTKVAEEHHEDGELHYHAIVYFASKQRLSTAHFDFESRHPNVKNIGRRKQDWDQCVAYLSKEDKSCIVTGTPRHQGCIWGEVANATSREQALEIVKTERPRDYVINSRQLDYFLDKVCSFLLTSRSHVTLLTNGIYIDVSSANACTNSRTVH